MPLVVVEDVDELEEGLATPVDAVRLGDGRLEELAEELELRDVARREAAQHVEQQLHLVHVVPVAREREQGAGLSKEVIDSCATTTTQVVHASSCTSARVLWNSHEVVEHTLDE